MISGKAVTDPLLRLISISMFSPQSFLGMAGGGFSLFLRISPILSLNLAASKII